MAQGSIGEIRIFDDFLGPDNDLTWGTGTVKVGNFGFVSVNEGSLEWTVDEPGGILAITTDTGDNDNAVLIAGTYKPADGGMTMECRFKFNSATLGAVYFGFAETMSLTTPVMPAEFDTVTMTYNGGGQIACVMDTDGTTIDFRAVGADGAVATGDADTNGTRANETIAADQWYIGRVEVDPDGTGRVYVGHLAGSDLKLVKEFNTALVTTTDVFYAVLMFENRSAAARVFEVDYIDVLGHRDWTV